MRAAKTWLIAALLAISVFLPISLPARPQQGEVKREAEGWVIEAVGVETSCPDVVYLLMKMESQSALATDATSQGEQRLREFLAAVEQLKIPNLISRVTSSMLIPASDDQSLSAGMTYARNIVFTLPHPGPGESVADLDRVIARLEDLGARYNVHCVTCIGFG
jgi:hypothetical protein